MTVSPPRVHSPIRLSQRAVWSEGQPISELMSQALANPHLISLAAGFVDQQSLPVEETQAALSELMADSVEAHAALQYGTTPGYPPLRRALLDRFVDGGPTHEDQIVVTAGSNQLLHLVCESLLDPGDVVLCAAPTYLVFLGTLQNLGARAWGVAADAQGMIPEALQAALEQLDGRGELHRVKAIYLVPYFDNPSGALLPAERRAEIVAMAKRWSRHQKIHVISDAAYRELRYDVDDVPATRTFDEDGDTVVEAGTFSKSFSPGIRVGWGVLPEHLVTPVCNQKGNIDFGSPNFSQHLMAKVLQRGLFEPHVERLRETYSAKLQALLSAADGHLAGFDGVTWDPPLGGLYVWLRLPERVDTGMTGRLFEVAVQEGVLYVPGQYCFPAEGEPTLRNTMRLSFGVQSCDKIDEGMAALARAIRAVL